MEIQQIIADLGFGKFWPQSKGSVRISGPVELSIFLEIFYPNLSLIIDVKLLLFNTNREKIQEDVVALRVAKDENFPQILDFEWKRGQGPIIRNIHQEIGYFTFIFTVDGREIETNNGAMKWSLY